MTLRLRTESTVLRGVGVPAGRLATPCRGDVAHALGFVTPQTRSWLLRELGEATRQQRGRCSARRSRALVCASGPGRHTGRVSDSLNWEQRSAVELLLVLVPGAKTGRELDYTQLGEQARRCRQAKSRACCGR